jgi:hypothetical protein
MTARIAPLIWPYIERGVDRLIEVAASVSPEDLAHRPEIQGGNSIATLAGHTLANAEDNLLGALLGEDVTYDRERDFASPELDIVAIRARWARIHDTFAAQVEAIEDSRLLVPMEHPRRGAVTGLEVMVVVARHVAEHLAHAELTRDLLRSTAD